MSSSNCCFLTCTHVSREAGKVVWYSHLLKNYPQLTVIDTVQGFRIVNEAKVDVFLELSVRNRTQEEGAVIPRRDGARLACGGSLAEAWVGSGLPRGRGQGHWQQQFWRSGVFTEVLLEEIRACGLQDWECSPTGQQTAGLKIY